MCVKAGSRPGSRTPSGGARPEGDSVVAANAGSGTSLCVLGAEKVQAIHDASLRVLSETGVTMPLSPPQREQARELGLLVDSETERVRFPPAIVAQAVRDRSTMAVFRITPPLHIPGARR